MRVEADAITSGERKGRVVAEVALAFVLATATAAVLYRLQSIPFVRANLHALVAAVFLILPQLLLRGRDLGHYGYTTQPRRLGLVIAAVGIFGILPLFALAFVGYARGLCALVPSLMGPACAHVAHPHLRLPPDFALLSAAQLIVVALPEELFFRGYLQTRLEEVLPPRRRLWGAPVGGAWLATAALFALGHYFVTFEPQMLTRFFPGLVFGWMFARTRSILAGTLFHACCNLLMDVLARSFFT